MFSFPRCLFCCCYSLLGPQHHVSWKEEWESLRNEVCLNSHEPLFSVQEDAEGQQQLLTSQSAWTQTQHSAKQGGSAAHPPLLQCCPTAQCQAPVLHHPQGTSKARVWAQIMKYKEIIPNAFSLSSLTLCSLKDKIPCIRDFKLSS